MIDMQVLETFKSFTPYIIQASQLTLYLLTNPDKENREQCDKKYVHIPSRKSILEKKQWKISDKATIKTQWYV